MTQGRFITLEGGEGAGKSTQLQLLAEALRAQGKTVITTREPGGTEGAEAIRGLLLTGGQDRWNDATEALLFAAARADHVAKLIRPALARGDWVVCDRFIDSTRAYLMQTFWHCIALALGGYCRIAHCCSIYRWRKGRGEPKRALPRPTEWVRKTRSIICAWLTGFGTWPPKTLRVSV